MVIGGGQSGVVMAGEGSEGGDWRERAEWG